MRLCSDHPSLVTHSKTAMPIVHAEGDAPEEILTCRICFDEAEDAISSACRHIFCVRLPSEVFFKFVVLILTTTFLCTAPVYYSIHRDRRSRSAPMPGLSRTNHYRFGARSYRTRQHWTSRYLGQNRSFQVEDFDQTGSSVGLFFIELET